MNYKRGTRKTSVAVSFLSEGKHSVNNQDISSYFKEERFIDRVLKPLRLLGMEDKFFNIKVKGGGKSSQADAVSLSISKYIHSYIANDEQKLLLRSNGLITTDSRRHQPEKPGYDSARRPKTVNKR